MKVKVCGMRDAGNTAEIAALKPDYMGFIFYKPSPRNCIGMDSSIIASLPEGVEPVMVSVDMQENEIIAIAGRYGFHTLQLHGNESPDICRKLRSHGFKVIKAIGMHTKESLKDMQKYAETIDMFLLDTFTPSKGGSGRKFDWNILADYNFRETFMLSGG
ncbi:MAG: phosphoribosylanthranilate isomerase, partial [Muribaculaceae bacterium]|nr:phosphoribosylanthranilate isomerase [Muribaculaceae bacterium]